MSGLSTVFISSVVWDYTAPHANSHPQLSQRSQPTAQGHYEDQISWSLQESFANLKRVPLRCDSGAPVKNALSASTPHQKQLGWGPALCSASPPGDPDASTVSRPLLSSYNITSFPKHFLIPLLPHIRMYDSSWLPVIEPIVPVCLGPFTTKFHITQNPKFQTFQDSCLSTKDFINVLWL